MFGSAAADRLRGDAGANLLGGSGGADTLEGRDGNDTLVGDGGALDSADRISGGGDDRIEEIAACPGADTVEGGTGRDTFVIARLGVAAADLQAVNFSPAAGFAPRGWTILGTPGADGVLGSAFGEVIQTFGGDDFLVGMGGDDTLDGGAGTDTTSYILSSAAVRVDLLAGTASGGMGNDSLIGIDNVAGTTLADTLLGSDAPNVLNGEGGGDVLMGRGGEDWLIAGADGAALSGDDGNDSLTGDAGNDTFAGGAGDDVLAAAADSAAGLRFDLGSDVLLLPGLTEAELAARDFVFR